jgi:hypothetical protein
MSYTTERLYELLPEIYRVRDAEQGHALKMLLDVMAREIGLVEADIDQLYANWFIETCEEWVTPYVGDLLGTGTMHALAAAGFTQRAYVANTLGYRRRKGTATVLEQLARDTTLWNARAVEFFELLATSQYMKHIRLHNAATPDLRQTNSLELLNTPFDTVAHTADVRRIASERGKHNIPNVGLFLWRLQAYFMARTTPAPLVGGAADHFTFHPLGIDAPIFNRPQTEELIAHLAEEHNVPGRVRRRALNDDLNAVRAALQRGSTPFCRYLGNQPILAIYFDDSATPLPPEAITVCDLSGWDDPLWQAPQREIIALPVQPPDPPVFFETKVAVDPMLGRLVLLRDIADPPANLRVSCTYGFSADIGGGPYDRRPPAGAGDALLTVYENSVAAPEALDARLATPTAALPTPAAAVALWDSSQPQTVIEVTDNQTYVEDLDILMGSTDLIIQAANFMRPTLVGDVIVRGSQRGRLMLNGLQIAGRVIVAEADCLRQLDIIHCTLVPGLRLDSAGEARFPREASVRIDAPNDALQVNIADSITGPLHLPEDIGGLSASDSIVESPVRGQPALATPALLSGSLSNFPALAVANPRLTVTIDNDGPIVLTLSANPTTIAQARELLQAALRTAHDGPAFQQARVLAAANRLIVIAGRPGVVRMENVLGATGMVVDDSAMSLKLTPETAQATTALLSGPLAPFPTLDGPNPALLVALGDATQTVTLSAVPASLAQARDRLQEAIRKADPADSAFSQALVAAIADEARLVVLAGDPALTPRFDPSALDATTLGRLKLAAEGAALAADGSGVEPGPPVHLVRTTILGPVHVKAIELASETIFAGSVTADHRQVGCLRFSFVPDGSRAPRRFRCQPELAISEAIASAASGAGRSLLPAEEARVRAHILGRLTPSFTSTRFGDPAYGQLRRGCSVEIQRGAENGSEMGAFSQLMQPQREANLRNALDEYLRFGLEAGIFFVT